MAEVDRPLPHLNRRFRAKRRLLHHVNKKRALRAERQRALADAKAEEDSLFKEWEEIEADLQMDMEWDHYEDYTYSFDDYTDYDDYYSEDGWW